GPSRRPRAREGLALGRAGAGAQLGMLGEIVMAGSASLLICMFLGPRFIDYLRLKEFGQQIREEGPAGHHGKAGTPTMGGIAIFLSILVPFLILSDYRAASLAVLGTALVMAALGFADDIIKLRKRRSLGVSGRTKLLVQALTAIALWLFVTQYMGLNDTLRLRVIDASVELGYVYPLLIFLVLAGATNGVNLTDGLDGLAAGCCAIVFLTYTAMTFIVPGEHDLALLSASLVGACVGFLWFNSFPASVFMGDTGSLGLGGAIAALAVMTKTELLLIVIGGIFVIEALSVAIQVIAFQRFRRRVFLMAPIHHHFELAGWSETKIILRFWIVAAICAAIGFTLYQASIP
ncbi:MAG TPA: phospho-N-acetylmuramoyl-pentapeptide-transferase, partial [Thermoleophilaceae bacterium]|nr:phospho-N-acetylmuramoyl-pentapeptide-transferase [Thermoleophilaceae bacterium]